MSEYNMTFMTPTVNFFMQAPDFVTFVENLDRYLEAEITESSDETDEALPYPVFLLDDLKIFAVHYKTLEDFSATWNRRKKRLHKDNLFVIFTDRDGFEDSLLPRIDAIPYRKVLFSHLDYPEYDWVCYIPGFENESEVVVLTDFIGLSGRRWYSRYPFEEVFKEMSRYKA